MTIADNCKPHRLHTFSVKGSQFTVDSKYSPIKVLGSGAYGIVCSAFDEDAGCRVAIKQVSKVFEDEVDALRVLREVKLLRHLDHPNIIKLLDGIVPDSLKQFRDLYLVFEYMDADLHKIIHSNPPQLTDDHVRFILVQIFSGVKNLHSANIIHRDLKPSNLLLNEACQLKICDLGLARGIHNDGRDCDVDLTEYVVTRWYRAPEVMCSNSYGFPVDMWAIGCILAEMLNLQPIFPGDNYADMLNRFVRVLGKPSDVESWATSPQAVKFLSGLKDSNGTPFRQLFPTACDDALDLLSKLLEFNPAKRITVDEALQHPFVAPFLSSHVEFKSVKPFCFDFEKESKCVDDVRRMMFEEINSMKNASTIEMSTLTSVIDEVTRSFSRSI